MSVLMCAGTEVTSGDARCPFSQLKGATPRSVRRLPTMVMHSVMKLLLVSTQPGPCGIRWLDYPCKNTAPQGKKWRRRDAARFKTNHRRNELTVYFSPLESAWLTSLFPLSA